MVKMTIKRADDSPDNKKWICKRIDDARESEQTEGTSQDHFAEDGKSSNEVSGNLHTKMPSHLEIQQNFQLCSPENNSNILGTEHLAHSHGTANSAGNSYSDPMDLSLNHSKRSPPRDINSNVNFNNSIGAHSAKTLLNFPNTPRLTGSNQVVHGEDTSFDSAMRSQNNPFSASQKLIASGEFVSNKIVISPSTNQNFSMKFQRNFPMDSGFVNSEKIEITQKDFIPNHQHQEAIRPFMKNYSNFSADTQNYGFSSTGQIYDPNKTYIQPMAPVSNGFPMRNEGMRQEQTRQLQTNYSKFSPGTQNYGHSSIAQIYDPNTYFGQSMAPVSNGFPIRNEGARQQEATRPLQTNYLNFSGGNRHYGHPSIAQGSDHNKYYTQSMVLGNNGLQFRNECAEGIGVNSVNKPTNSLKRLSQTCVEISNNDEFKTVNSSKRKKLHTKVPNKPYHCNMCNVTCKTEESYKRHLLKATHKANEVIHQQSNLHNFQLGFLNRLFGPMVLNSQPQLNPLLNLMGNPILCQKMLQPNALNAVNQPGGGLPTINNSKVPNYFSGSSKSNCNELSPSLNRFRNNFETKNYVDHQGQMNLPVNHINNLRAQLENSPMASLKYFENKASQFISSPKVPSHQIHPKYASMRPILARSDSYAMDPDRPKISTACQKLGDFQSEPNHKSDFFRVYHCLVCSTFHTDSLQKLEQHVAIDRGKIPFHDNFAVINTASGESFYCGLCEFVTQNITEIKQHCDGIFHLKRVDYFNHVMEGGVQVKEKLKNMLEFSSVALICFACDFTTMSMDILRAHSVEPSHQNNALCYMYISKFSSEVEYCFCVPCIERTSTKRELLLHVRSTKHMDMLRQYQPIYEMQHDPAQLYFVKELTPSKVSSVSEYNGGRLYDQTEKPRLRKENNEKTDITSTPAPIDLSSASSTSLKIVPVNCPLCQKGLPEISYLVQHLQQFHGVNETGVKWLISTATRTNEEKSPTAEKSESIVFSPQNCSTPDPAKAIPVRGMSIDSSLSEKSTESKQSLKSKSPVSLKAGESEVNMEMDQKLYQKEMACADSSSSPKLNITLGKQNTNQINRNIERRTDQEFSLSQQHCKEERIQNPERSSVDSSTHQHSLDNEGMQSYGEPNQNSDFNQGTDAIDFTSIQKPHEAERAQFVREEKISNSEEILNSSGSSEAEVIVETESEQNGYSSNESLTDDSFREHFSAKEDVLPTLPSGLDTKRKRKMSSSSDYDSLSQFRKTEGIVSSGKENLKSSSSQTEVVVGNESQQNGERECEKETDDSSIKHISANGHESPVSEIDRNTKVELKERLPEIEDYSNLHLSLISQSGSEVIRERNDSFSSEINCRTPERLLEIYDSTMLATSPISKSDLDARREWCDTSLYDHNYALHDQSSLRDISSSDEHHLQTSPSSLNLRKYSSPSGLSQCSLSIQESAREHGSPKSQSGLKAKKKRNDSSSSDGIFVEYKCMLEAKRDNSSQHYVLESENRKSPLDDKENLNLRENEVSGFPINIKTVLVESKQKVDDFSSVNKTLDDTIKIVLCDRPYEYETEFSASSFPAEMDAQIQARKNIERLEISNVVSLASQVENSSNVDEKEESFDFDEAILSYLDEL